MIQVLTDAAILLSIVFVIAETHPVLHESISPGTWFAVQGALTLFFLVEWVVRLGIWTEFGNKYRAFFRTPLNIADGLAVLPWFLTKVWNANRFFEIFQVEG